MQDRLGPSPITFNDYYITFVDIYLILQVIYYSIFIVYLIYILKKYYSVLTSQAKWITLIMLISLSSGVIIKQYLKYSIGSH